MKIPLLVVCRWYILDNYDGDWHIGGKYISANNYHRFGLFLTEGNEKLRIESGGGLKFTGQGTSIPLAGIRHHTNNNLYVKGGTVGLILSNQDNTNTTYIRKLILMASQV